MRIEQLVYLVDVAKTKSINVSAERLYITQPAISDAIHKLEEELGVLLLERSKRGVSLTNAGTVAVAHAEEIIKHLTTLRLEVTKADDRYDKNLAGHLRIGAVSLSNIILIPEMLAEFYKLYPHILIDSFNVRHYEMKDFLLSDVMDVGILNISEHKPANAVNAERDDLIDNDDLVAELIFSDPLSLIVHKDSPLAKKKLVSLAEMLSYPMVLFGNNSVKAREINNFLINYGSMEMAVVTDNPDVYRQAIINGLGVGLFSQTSYADMFSNSPKDGVLKIVALKEDIFMNFYVIYKKDKLLSDEEKAFIHYAKAYLRPKI